MLDQGVWAEVRVGAEHLRLFSESNAQGLQASVYNAVTKTWVAPSEAVAVLKRARTEPRLMPGYTSRAVVLNSHLLNGKVPAAHDRRAVL